MKRKDQMAQFTGFDITKGGVGYLREAYHGEPYATKYLCQEAFESQDGSAKIPSETLKTRLNMTLSLHVVRQKVLYNEDVGPDSPSAKSFVDFVALYEKLEKEGKNPVIKASY